MERQGQGTIMGSTLSQDAIGEELYHTISWSAALMRNTDVFDEIILGIFSQVIAFLAEVCYNQKWRFVVGAQITIEHLHAT